MTIYQRPYIQRGRGLGSLFGSLFRSVVPVVSKFGRSIVSSPVTKSIGSALKNSALETVGSVGADLLRGEDLSQTLDKNLAQARNKVADALEKSTKQPPNKKRKKTKKTTEDLFDG